MNHPQFPVNPTLLLSAFLAVAGTVRADFESNLEKTFPGAPGGRLVVVADRGAINVTTTDQNQVAIQVLRQVKGGTRENADRLFTDHEVKFSQDGSTIRVEAKSKEARQRHLGGNAPYLEVRYEIAVPQKFSVDLQTAGGGIQVGPALDGDATVQTAAGKIALRTVTGAVHAKDSGGEISVDDAGGAVTAQTSAGRIVLGRVGGPVEAKTSGGEIRIGSAGNRVNAQTSAGSIRVQAVRGDLTAVSSGGGIQVENCGGAVSAKTSAGAVRVRQAQGSVDAQSSGGEVEINDCGGDVVARTSAGRITLGRIQGKVEAKNSGGSITVAAAQGAVLATSSAGALSASFTRRPTADSRLEVSGGSVTVALPENAGVNLDARTSGGSVTSELPVTIEVTGSPKAGELRGKINGGGPTFTLRTSAGNIVVKKLAAEAP